MKIGKIPNIKIVSDFTVEKFLSPEDKEPVSYAGLQKIQERILNYIKEKAANFAPDQEISAGRRKTGSISG
ncbi:MAG: hypothetical protein OEZ34_03765 [Spirochaetia bacterium]|nr:hypothetical protein [Spirochaetia bacterium]